MNVLFDINVLLDVFLDRPGLAEDSDRVWELHRQKRITAFVAAFSIPTLFYIVRRQLNLAKAFSAVDDCLAIFDLIPIERLTLEQARMLQGSDFEDCLQIASAMSLTLDAIVTRDPAGFQSSPIPVFSPSALIAKVSFTES